MPLRRITARYTGRVQGVGFRATARSTASSFQITGWVRNEPDGSVSLEAQGEPSELQRFLGAFADRMKGNIQSFTTMDAPLETDERTFDVRR